MVKDYTQIYFLENKIYFDETKNLKTEKSSFKIFYIENGKTTSANIFADNLFDQQMKPIKVEAAVNQKVLFIKESLQPVLENMFQEIVKKVLNLSISNLAAWYIEEALYISRLEGNSIFIPCPTLSWSEKNMIIKKLNKLGLPTPIISDSYLMWNNDIAHLLQKAIAPFINKQYGFKLHNSCADFLPAYTGYRPSQPYFETKKIEKVEIVQKINSRCDDPANFYSFENFLVA